MNEMKNVINDITNCVRVNEITNLIVGYCTPNSIPLASVGGLLFAWENDDCGGQCDGLCGKNPGIIRYICHCCAVHEVKSCDRCHIVCPFVKNKCKIVPESRGLCGRCGTNVYVTQSRVKESGIYFHYMQRDCKIK